MKQLIFGALLVLVFACNSASQSNPLPSAVSTPITLSGRIANLPISPPPGLVEYWTNDRWQQLDVFDFGKDGSFSKVVTPVTTGQCRIRVGNRGKSWSEFVLPGPGTDLKELVFDLDYKMMSGSPTRVTGSPENDTYFDLLNAYKALQRFRDSIGATPQKALFAAAQKQFNQRCLEVSKANKGTFTGDIVAKLLYQPQPGDYPNDPKVAALSPEKFILDHRLDKVPFGDERIFYHNEFFKTLDLYAQLYPETPEGGKDLIEHLMAHRNGNSQVDVFVFKYLLDRMMSYENEAGLSHLLTWFVPDCPDETPLPNMTQTLLGALKNCTPGKEATNLQLKDLNGDMTNLGAICAKNKVTLLFFWRSTCSHCREFEPELIKIYEKYHPLGVEVYAISTDGKELDWKAYMQQHPTPWINVWGPGKIGEEINRLFPLVSTPTLISLDKERKVMSRLIIRESLAAYLDEQLKKSGR